MGKKGPQRGQKRATRNRARQRRVARDRARRDHRADELATVEELDQLVDFVRGDLLDAVSDTVRARDAGPGRELLASIVALADQAVAEGEDLEEAGLPLELSLMVALEWLRGIREAHAGAGPAVLGWIGDELGPEVAAVAEPAADLLTEAPDEAWLGELFDTIDDDLLPALVWLVAGAVATLGNGDPMWLEQFVAKVD